MFRQNCAGCGQQLINIFVFYIDQRIRFTRVILLPGKNLDRGVEREEQSILPTFNLEGLDRKSVV